MKILQIHNYYQQAAGEREVFLSDLKILTSEGHQIVQYKLTNDQIPNMSLLSLFTSTFWNQKVYLEIGALIESFRPDICHFHNTFPLISPSGYYACNKHAIPVVQRLQNYRLICPNALLFRNGMFCHDCVGKLFPWPGILHVCYRNSFGASATTALMLMFHRLLRTYKDKVDVYIALNEFGKGEFIKGGLPADKIVISPNVVEPDPGVGKHSGNFALFVGRFSKEKGILTLLNAWMQLSDIPLIIVGDGPQMSEARAFIENNAVKNITLLGRKPHHEVLEMMKESRLLVFPSEWPEPFGITIIEGFACGLPVIASRQKTLQESVVEGENGLFFSPGDPNDLAEKIRQLWNDEERLSRMGKLARTSFENKFSRQQKYESLMKIYKKAIEESGSNG